MPAIDLSILNQRQTPAFYADTLANRPSAGFIGRIFVSTNTFEFYRDNGTTWDLIGGPGTSTVTGTGANGQVTYWNGTSSITGSNDLFFDAVNGHFGVGTITPGTALDVKHNQSTLVQLEQETATNDTRIAFINSGVGLWRLGAFYNAGANDFGLFDIAASAQPVTVKRTTGQVLIGTSTVGSGKLVVASATGDNGVQIVGASAPSLRIDNAESGPSKRIGIGLATATNNFIQGAADRDMCIFNGSTTISPILFGIYQTTNVQEVARFSVAGNLLVGKTTDAGYKLDVSGTSRISGNLLVEAPSQDNILSVIGQSGFEGALFISSAGSGKDANIVFGNGRNLEFHTSSSTTPVVSGTQLMTLTASGNVGIGISTGFNADSAVETTLQIASINVASLYLNSTTSNKWSIGATGSGNLNFQNLTTSTITAQISTAGNFLIGTTTDAGQKLQVNGNVAITGSYSGVSAFLTTTLSAQVGKFNTNGNNAFLEVAASSGEVFRADAASGAFRIVADQTKVYLSSRVNINSIPTSATGLSSGDIYSNLGVLTIVP